MEAEEETKSKELEAEKKLGQPGVLREPSKLETEKKFGQPGVLLKRTWRKRTILKKTLMKRTLLKMQGLGGGRN